MSRRLGSRSIEGRVAVVTKLASCTLFAGPDPIEALLSRIEHGFIVGHHPHLEVSTTITLRAETRAGEVGAAEIKKPSVDGDHLEMDARTATKSKRMVSMTFELGSERPRGRRRVQDPNVDAPPRELT